mmetsp:Transcript_19446/g.52034  ORF Transcript_19446/g.52034 Transcript_19446/m.52034 type:complete len:178 (-) Transcript_19446:25-558(-)
MTQGGAVLKVNALGVPCRSGQTAPRGPARNYSTGFTNSMRMSGARSYPGMLDVERHKAALIPTEIEVWGTFTNHCGFEAQSKEPSFAGSARSSSVGSQPMMARSQPGRAPAWVQHAATMGVEPQALCPRAPGTAPPAIQRPQRPGGSIGLFDVDPARGLAKTSSLARFARNAYVAGV